MTELNLGYNVTVNVSPDDLARSIANDFPDDVIIDMILRIDEIVCDASWTEELIERLRATL